MESFFDKFMSYLIVTLLEMGSVLTILLQVFLKPTNVNFFVYKTTEFIHVAAIDFIDRFSNFATGKSLIFCEGARTIRQEISKSLVGFCLSKLHPEFEDLYEHCKVIYCQLYFQKRFS